MGPVGMVDLERQGVFLLMLHEKISQSSFVKHSAPRLARLDTFPQMALI
jgi:hypothetical protein